MSVGRRTRAEGRKASGPGWSRAKRAWACLGAIALLGSLLALATVFISPRKPTPIASSKTPERSTRAAPQIASPVTVPADAQVSKQGVREQMLSLPLRFERNEGQFARGVRYLARRPGGLRPL